jgi:hypothetical protein
MAFPARAQPLAAVALAALCACAAKVDGALQQAAQTVAVTVSPGSASLMTGQGTQFAAAVTGTADTAATWRVDESAGGAIDETGLYVAPLVAGTYHVRAVSHADPAASGVATVAVSEPPPGTVTTWVSPSTFTLDACTAHTFTASVSGSSDQGVTWSVTEGSAGGTVTSAGAYTAPSSPGTYHLVATSKATPSATGTATLTVRDHIVSIAVNPPTASVNAGAKQQFTAKVTTTCGTFTATAN